MNDQATNMAQKSADWAQERTRLAKERTFAAVVRTALSLIGSGSLLRSCSRISTSPCASRSNASISYVCLVIDCCRSPICKHFEG